MSEKERGITIQGDKHLNQKPRILDLGSKDLTEQIMKAIMATWMYESEEALLATHEEIQKQLEELKSIETEFEQKKKIALNHSKNIEIYAEDLAIRENLHYAKEYKNFKQIYESKNKPFSRRKIFR
jgi:hypothetical protein